MIKTLSVIGTLALYAGIAFAAQDVVSAVDGTVKKVDAGTKTVVVATADGADHTFHYAGDLAVHGGKDVAEGSKDTLHGLEAGTRVAVHYTTDGAKDTAHEIDRIGHDDLKLTEGTVTHVDKGAKKIYVATADGAEETFHLTDRAAKDTGKGIVDGTEKTAKVTVYYTETAGEKTAHFIKSAL